MNTIPAHEDKPSQLMAKLPLLLRVLGATALLIAMYSFLARGWQNGNDVFRYFMMLGHTGLLAAIGIASGHWLKEGKGARLLLSLALVSVPANFAILGAFLFSQMNLVDVSLYPQYLAWHVDSLAMALGSTGLALLVLVPVILLGFRVLARSMSKTLSLLFLAGNFALLLPLRDPQGISLLVAVLLVGVVWISRKAAMNQISAKTSEGVLALGLQLLPLTVLLGRSLWLYSYDLFLVTVLTLSLYFILRQISLLLPAGGALRNLVDMLSLAPAVSMALLLADALQQTGLFADALVFPLGSLAASLLVLDISRRNTDRVSMYRRISMLILLVGMGANLLIFSNLAAALVCTGSGAALLVYGFRSQQRSLFISGILLTLAGVTHQLLQLFYHFDLGSWAGLALAGVLSIVVASVLESQGTRLRERMGMWKSQLRSWES